MNKFALPTNIRQIGNTDGVSMKIYMEDYVCSYLKQYAESGGHTEKIAFLVGKYMIIDAVPYVFVHGVIQGVHSEYIDNMETFTDASYDHAEEELARYFPGSEILGWMQSQPGYGVHLNPSYADYHMNNFTRPYQVLFVMDPIEKLNLFYMWNTEMTGVEETGGYFVYYDQNKGMQEYMNNNRINRAKVREVAKKTEDVPSTRLKIFEDSQPKKKPKEEKRDEAPARALGRRSSAMSSVKTTHKEERSVEDMRKMSNLLIGLCAVLFITTFIMGAGLLQSDSRISALENAIVTIDGNHVVIADQIRQLASLPVFASGQDVHAQAVSGDNVADGTGQYEYTPAATPQPTVTPPPTPSPEPVATPTPQPTPEATPPPEEATPVFANIPETYVIQPGDTLFAVSQMFYGDIGMVARIMELNDIEDANHIVIGQVLILPSY
ncbi:MAG: LysM peptidoglycan-binding domain-containing protein [Defluviitaleaceae bacterium]|nr:LysM peptidoglycan-binding domain-containing protein [Defluviitaleaceae bacterium]